jgi:lipoprotein-anchoring transpeptidase ErfK/SrfK
MKKRDINHNKKNNKVTEKNIILYAVLLVCAGLVVGLTAKMTKLDKKDTTQLVATESDAVDSTADKSASSDDTANVSGEDQASDSDEDISRQDEPATDSELSVEGDIESREIMSLEAYQNRRAEEYNGEKLEDNGLTYAIKVNRQENIVTVYALDSEGYYTVPVRAMTCSVSPDGNTPTGLFTTSLKWEWLSLYNYSYGQYVTQIQGDILFHSVPYSSRLKDGLETWEFNKLGTSASLGCIRLCVADTKWIYENCDAGTYVNIFDSDYCGPLGRPMPATKLEDTENTGWDPTDMVEENPYTGSLAIYGVMSHSIQVGENYDTMAGVMAFDKDMQDVTDKVKVTGSVDNKTAGTYKISYTLSVGGETVTAEAEIQVIDKETPAVISQPKSISISNYDGSDSAKDELATVIGENVVAYDNDKPVENVVCTDNLSSSADGDFICVDLTRVKTEAGTYKAYYYVVDASGNKTGTRNVDICVR